MKFLLILVVSLNFWEKFERETIGNCLASETLSEKCRNYRKMMEFGRNSKSADELELEDGGGVWHTTRRKRRKRSTGGTFSSSHSKDTICKIGIDEFRNMSTDDKLVSLFEVMTSFGSTNARVNKLEGDVHSLLSLSEESDRLLKLLEYKSIDTEARIRRHNLIFRGHPEVVGDDDCEAIIVTFLRRLLDIEGVYIQRAHRIGNPFNRRSGQYAPLRTDPRPIIACFRDYKDIERILSNAYKLRDTNFGINRDYPPEITSARSKLWPDYKLAKSRSKSSKVYIGYPAKLVVGGRVIKDVFPDWKSIMKGSRTGVDSVGTEKQQEPTTVRQKTGHVLTESTRPINTENSQSILQDPPKNYWKPTNASDTETVMDSDKSDVDSSAEIETSADKSSTNLTDAGCRPKTPATDKYSKEIQKLQSMVELRQMMENAPINLVTNSEVTGRSKDTQVNNK